MTLLQDVQAEYAGLIGEDMTHYPANEVVDEGDNFWHKEDGWDKSSGTDFKGVVDTARIEDISEDAGFDKEIEIAVRTGFDGADTGDLVEFGDGREAVIIAMTELRAQGENYSTIFGLREKTDGN